MLITALLPFNSVVRVQSLYFWNHKNTDNIQARFKSQSSNRFSISKVKNSSTGKPSLPTINECLG
mgnify:FL=1